ncbi:hypothetical protein [Metasolibacillus meyeri]|uniref:hypothetical protein n=1 Tax=Metasolibacillus meyeri TaxID=1071052 RepID=UPI000D3039D8|nr:hypothetical protein [Metasolibacillus meyeri]
MVKSTIYGNTKEILKYAEHQSITRTFDDTGIVANADGKKIIPAGTIVGGGFIEDDSELVVAANTSDAEGVALYDVDVTHGPAVGAVVLRGFIDLNKIPTAPTTDAKTALGSRITFMV